MRQFKYNIKVTHDIPEISKWVRDNSLRLGDYHVYMDKRDMKWVMICGFDDVNIAMAFKLRFG